MKTYSILKRAIIDEANDRPSLFEHLIVSGSGAREDDVTALRQRWSDAPYRNEAGELVTWTVVALLDTFDCDTPLPPHTELYSRFLGVDRPLHVDEVLHDYFQDLVLWKESQ